MNLWDKAVDALEDKHKHNVDFQRTDKNAILADVLEEVQKKKQACIERRLKYKRKNGEFLVLYDVYEKMVKWVMKFKEVGDVAVQYDPGHAALPWAAIRFFLQVSVNDVQIFGSLAEGLEEVCKIIARYSVIESLYLRQSASVGDLLKKAIIALYASILVFFSKCRKYFDLGLARRLARGVTQVPEQSISKYLKEIAVNDRNVIDLTRIIDAERTQLSGTRQSTMSDRIDNLGNEIETLRIGSRKSEFRLETLLASFQNPLIRTVEGISTLAEIVAHSNADSEMKDERLQILLWLSNTPYKTHHHSLSKGLLKGTGSWLLEKPQFVDWRNSSVSSVLWLHGIPGSGKTCLTSTVIQQLLAENSACEDAAPIAYFYCQRNTAEPQRSDPTEVLRAILRQLLCYNPLWQEESSTAKGYRKRKSDADVDGFEISRLDILETRDQIIEIASQMPVTILIDALDECRSSQRHELLGALDIILEKSAHLVKVFVSSRDDVDIVLRLQEHPNIYISVRDNTGDIHRFIQFEIQKAQSDRRLLKGIISPELTELITESLTKKAEGMFLWVSLQIENLCDSRRIKVEGDLVDELARLPRSLADMYSLLLGNISQIEQRGRTTAETVLKWLLCTKDARSRVTIAACSDTTSTERGCLSISDILDVCSTLVVYDKWLDRFQFAHLSIREFLESQPGYAPSEANRSVLERSLQTLMDDQSPKDPFRSYAMLNWVFHYKCLEEKQRKEVFELHTKRFLLNGVKSSEFFKVNWFKQYMLENTYMLRITSESLKCVDRWAEDFGIQHKEIDYFHDNVQTPVELASCFGWLEILDYFEASQIPDDIREPAVRMMTIAIYFGRISVVRWLIVRNIHPTNQHLMLAFSDGRSEIVQNFVDMNVISFDTLVNGQETLVLAVRSGFRKVYQDLVKKGGDWNFRDRSGRTLLSHAVSCSHGNSEIIEDLLLAGIDPIAPDNAGRTPLWFSLWGEHSATSRCALLTRQSLNSSAIEDSETVLRHVLLSSHHHNACLLLHYGPESVLEDGDMREGWTKLLEMIAKLPNLQKITLAWVMQRAGKLSDDSEIYMHLAGQTLLSLAALFRHEEAFRVLLSLGIDPTCPAICEIRKRSSVAVQTDQSMSGQEASDQGRVNHHNIVSDELRQGPLAWAAYTGNLSLVQSILDRGLDVNIKNRNGQTALYFAAQQTEDQDPRLEVDKEAIVRLLLQKGALVTSADAYSGASVLVNAFKARYSQVAKILLDHGAEMPKGLIDGPMEQVLGAFQSGHGGIRQTLIERAQGGAVDLPRVQWSSSGRRYSSDPWDIVAQLTWRGTIRALGDTLDSIR